MGDFNVTLFSNERVSNSDPDKHGVAEFVNFCQQLNFVDLPHEGMKYTRTNRQTANDRVWCKLDRVMGNKEWFISNIDAKTNFSPPNISDHSPMLIQIQTLLQKRRRAFKFLNGWTLHPDFLEIVKKGCVLCYSDCETHSQQCCSTWATLLGSQKNLQGNWNGYTPTVKGES